MTLFMVILGKGQGWEMPATLNVLSWQSEGGRCWAIYQTFFFSFNFTVLSMSQIWSP